MRFMVMVKADKNTEAGALPDEKLLTAMGKYNEELVKAGVMQAGGGVPAGTEGPAPESRDLVAGFWIFQVKSKDEAIEWVKRCPNPTGAEGEIEIRQIFEAEDFGPALTPALREAAAR